MGRGPEMEEAERRIKVLQDNMDRIDFEQALQIFMQLFDLPDMDALERLIEQAADERGRQASKPH